MLDHFGVTVTDMSKSLPFYEACLWSAPRALDQEYVRFSSI